MIIFQPWWQACGIILFILMVGVLIRNYIAANKAFASIQEPEDSPDKQPNPVTYLNAVEVETDFGTLPYVVDRLATFYDSDYVKANQPWIRETPLPAWLDRQLAMRGLSL